MPSQNPDQMHTQMTAGLEAPTLGVYDFRIRYAPLATVQAFRDMETAQLEQVLPGILGVHGATFNLLLRADGGRPKENKRPMAQYSGYLQLATSVTKELVVIDIHEMPPPTRSRRVVYHLGQALKWAITGDSMQPFDATPTARLSILHFPPQ